MINPNKIKKTRKHVVINETLFAEELKKAQIVVELRNFRPSTTASYIKSLSEFLQWLFDTKQLRIADASEDDLRDFLFYLKKERNPVLSPSTINIYNASIRKYFRYVLKKMLDRDSLPYMETDHPLPVVPGKKEVKKLI
jgi:site-specific recombinase XerD